MNLSHLEKHWDEFGKRVPHWALLEQPDKWNEFYRTGEEDIGWVLSSVRSLGLTPRGAKALDFGCGVGRLTQALANHFEMVCGVDISPAVIELAEKYNRKGDKCRFYANDKPDLRLFEDASFDFIYTLITLQHLEPQYIKEYLKEFIRLLVPQGILAFQLPTGYTSPVKQFVRSVTPMPLLNLYRWARYRDVFPRMEMYGMRMGVVKRLLAQNGAHVLGVVPDDEAGPGWASYHYFVRKA